MDPGEVNFEKLIGVNLSEHVTDMRCLKRGAAGCGPRDLLNQRSPQPHRNLPLVVLAENASGEAKQYTQ